MIFKILSLALTNFIKLYLFYVGIIWIIGISFWFFSLFTKHTIKLSEVLARPFVRKSYLTTIIKRKENKNEKKDFDSIGIFNSVWHCGR